MSKESNNTDLFHPKAMTTGLPISAQKKSISHSSWEMPENIRRMPSNFEAADYWRRTATKRMWQGIAGGVLLGFGLASLFVMWMIR